jgi:hypothetical protein
LESTIIDWDGNHLPQRLRDLPPGRYIVQPLAASSALTDEEEDGLMTALAEVEAGEVISMEDAFKGLLPHPPQ